MSIITEADKQQNNAVNTNNRTSEAPASSRRTGSLSIFFRKVNCLIHTDFGLLTFWFQFYNLAGVRMEHLCTKLGLNDADLKSRIWTIFEKSIRKSELIKDRHLDQLLMCAIYMICRIRRLNVMFQDIMRFYREQPQSNSKVYRDVLYSRRKTDESTFILKTFFRIQLFKYFKIYGYITLGLNYKNPQMQSSVWAVKYESVVMSLKAPCPPSFVSLVKENCSKLPVYHIFDKKLLKNSSLFCDSEYYKVMSSYFQMDLLLRSNAVTLLISITLSMQI